MRKTPMLDFSVEEYERRLGGLCALMQAQGVDAALITTMENVRYFCGFQSVVWPSKISTPGILILSQDGRRKLVGSKSAYETMRYTSCLEDDELLYYARPDSGEECPASYIDAIYSVLREFGATDKRLGLELGVGHRLHMNWGQYEQLSARLPAAEQVDLAPAIWSMRVIKSADEVAAMRETARISGMAFQKAFESIRLGETTEAELDRIYTAEAFRQGATAKGAMVLFFGEGRYEVGNCPPSDKVLDAKEHNVLQMDGGPVYKGYYSDTIRMGVVGELTDKQKDFLKMSYDALYFALDSIRPGVGVRELLRRLNAYVDSHGMGEYNLTRGGAGHGIGLQVHEPPLLYADGEDTLLRAGMVLAVEPTFGDGRWGHFSHEENLLVTEDGCEVFTSFFPDIVRL